MAHSPQTSRIAEDTSRCHDAINILRNALLGENSQVVEGGLIEAYISANSGVVLTLGALGSVACNVWTNGDSVLISIAGTPTPSTFYSFARSRLRASGGEIIIEKSDPEAFLIFQLSINSIRFEISYHQASQHSIAELWNQENLPTNPPISTSRHYTERSRTIKLAKLYNTSDSYRECCLYLKLWAKSRGLYSEIFSLLNDASILDLTVANILALQSAGTTDCTKEQFFFLLPKTHRQLALKAPAPVGTYTVSTLIINTIADISQSWTLPKINGLLDFEGEFPRYLQVELSYWGLSKVKRGRFLQAARDILAGFVKRLDARSAPHMQFRPWPERLVVESAQEADGPDSKDEAYYKGLYLAGVNWTSPLDDVAHVLDTLPQLLRDEISRDKHYDMNFAYVDVSWTTGISQENLIADLEDIGPLPEDKKPGSREDDDDELPALDVEPEQVSKKQASESTRNHPRSSSHENTDTNQRTPLRPALDVLNRIKNDHAMDSADYLIGYLDRHAGMKEMPVEWWITKEQTAEEFIPQSRIRYFKRISDGVTVWDREARLDLVFNSGRK